MIGLIVLVVITIYLIISLIITWKVFQHIGWKWGVTTGFLMYMLVFWDHIPTLLLHDHYCNTEAGFWVYTTPNKWLSANQQALNTNNVKEYASSISIPSNATIYKLNPRFSLEYTSVHHPHILPITVGKQSIIDTNTREEMVRRITVSSGYSGPGINSLKYWVGSRSCIPNKHDFDKLVEEFTNIFGVQK